MNKKIVVTEKGVIAVDLDQIMMIYADINDEESDYICPDIYLNNGQVIRFTCKRNEAADLVKAYYTKDMK